MRPLSTELLNQDPEALEQYFRITAEESAAHQKRIERIERFWHDWPKQEAKNAKAKRLSRLAKRK